jgi:hypothetical protein
MSKKPTDFDLFNDESLWGNQSAGELTHKEIVEINWNKKRTKKDKEKLSELSKKLNAERLSDPVISKQIRNKISKKRKGQKQPREAVEKMLETKKKNGTLHSPSWNKGIAPSTKTRKKIANRLKGRTLSNEIKEKIKINCAKNKKIVTPYGEFISRSEAARYIFNNKLTNLKSVNSTSVWIFTQTQQNPKQFYYVENTLDD